MKVLIAGGSGMIGQALSAHLMQGGRQVWVLTRSPQVARVPAGVQVVAWDGRTTSGWGDLMDEVDAVVNLAGENIGASPWTNARKQAIRSSRVAVGNALTEAIQNATHRPRVLLQASATGYYGPHGAEPINEDSPSGSDFQASIVRDWENSTRAVEDMGVRRVVTRSGMVLSTEGGALTRFVYTWRLGLGGKLGSGRQWYSWIHLQDEVEAFRFLLENESAAGVYNLTTPNPVTNAEFGRTLADVMRRPFWAPVPGFALKLLYGEMSTVVLEGQRVLPERLLASGYQFAFPQLRPALENLIHA